MSCPEQYENIIILVTLVGVLAGILIGYIVYGEHRA